MKQASRHPKYLWRRTVTIAVALCLLLMALTGAAVHFFDHLHYNNALLQADSQAASDQAEIGKVQYDVKLLISNSSPQFNCYDLRSTYARNLCKTHENNASNNLL